MKKLSFSLSFVLFFSLVKAAVVIGTNVGTGQTYTTLKSAFDAINAGTLTGAITLNITSNITETASAKLNASGVGSASYTSVTIMPSGGARTISGAFSDGSSTLTSLDAKSSIIFLNGADNVTIDGRIGGTGTTISLTIANTTAATVTSNVFAVRLTNDAKNNTVKYCTLKSNNGSQSYGSCGIAIINTPATGGTGNDNNSFDRCLFDGNGVAEIGFHSNSADDNVSITNNEFKNIGVCGIYHYRGGDNVQLNGNSFYWTTGVFSGTGLYAPLLVGNTFNTTVSGNYFGGTAAQCGGTPAVLSTTNNMFSPIILSGSCTGTLNIQGNTIANLDITATTGSSSIGGCFAGIFIFNNTSATGTINVGTTTPNIIGSNTAAGNIIIRSTATAASTGLHAYGIRNNINSSQTYIQNNKIGGMQVALPATNLVYVNLYGISTLKDKCTISGNTIGSTTVANSLENLSGATQTTTLFGTYGIHANYTSGSVSTIISNNTIANLNTNTVSEKAQAYGIYVSGSSSTAINITGNSISKLTTVSTNAGTGASASLTGIYGNFVDSIVSNTVTDCYQNETTAANNVIGIYNTSTSGTTVIEKNYIHHLTAASPNAAISGAYFNQGVCSFKNNFIHLGLKPDGTSITTGAAFYGIYDKVSSANLYNNSVYIGGSGVTSMANTYSIYAAAALPVARAYRNNIFVNNRSNASGNGKNGVIYLAKATDYSTPLLTFTNNIVQNEGTGMLFGKADSITCATFTAWKCVTGLDAECAETDPKFTNVTGNSATVNMHLLTSNPCEAKGVTIADVTFDYDGVTRNASTPDIGADEGSFTYNNADIAAPSVTFTDIANQTYSNVASMVLSSFATITDNVGVSASSNIPRFYYKKTTEADTFGLNTSAANGWKYVTASNTTSPYSFTINYTLLTGGGINSGDTIAYFVAAQDAANHLTSYPCGAGALSNPPIQNINYAPANVKTFISGVFVAPSITANPVNTVICSGTDTSFTVAASHTPTSYTWEFSANDTTWNIISAANAGTFYAGYNSNKLSLNGITAANNGLQYRVKASNSTGTSAYSDTVKLTAFTGTWQSTSSTDFTLSSNWSGCPPVNKSINIVVPSVVGIVAPSVTGNVLFKNIVVDSNAVITVNDTMLVYGQLHNNGTFNGTGVVILADSVAQTITGKGTIENLALNNAAGALIEAGAASHLTVTGSLIPTQGTFTTNGNLTLKSTALGTASIASVQSGAAISGNITVERYIPSDTRKSYVLMSSVVSGPTIYNAWQEGGSLAGTGYGTQITGAAAGNGFDSKSNSGLASIFTYNDDNVSGSKWVGLTNTNATTLKAGQGFLIYVRGDRSVLPTTPTGNNTTLRATGSITTGDTTIAASLTGGTGKFSLISNPYPSAINWVSRINGTTRDITLTDLDDIFYVYDPSLGTFASYNAVTNVLSPSDSKQSTKYLQSGQAFFVRSNGANPSVTFREVAKVNTVTAAGNTVFGAETERPRININVYKKADSAFADGVVAVFDRNYKHSIATEDAVKMNNFAETFSLKRGSELLSIEGRPLVTKSDTLFFSLQGFAKKEYALAIDGSHFKDVNAVLTDNYNNTKQVIDLSAKTTYSFTVNGDNASFSDNRFMIVLGSTAKESIITDAVDNSSLFVKMGPNPMVNILKVNFKTASAESKVIRIINSLGQVVARVDAGNINAGNITVPTGKLAAGFYTAQLLSGAKEIASQKIIKE